MTHYRNALPQLSGELFLTDGGIETTLIFHEGLELPHFAAFHLLKDSRGGAVLRDYFRTYAQIAKQFDTGLILESATWRASADWGARLGYSRKALADANRMAIHLLEGIRKEYEMDGCRVVVSGCVGPRGDGYVPSQIMSEREAEVYHREQIDVFADSAADMMCAVTMNYTEEAVGIARAAQRVGLPVAISFTTETDGRLPTGQSLQDAIEAVDEAASSYPSYFMINCAHPTHFEHVLNERESYIKRIRGVRANASRMSHSELNDSTELDIGDPADLGSRYADLKRRLPQLNVMGGCCGTDHRHINEIASACIPLFRTVL